MWSEGLEDSVQSQFSPLDEGDTITEAGDINNVIMFPFTLSVEWVRSSLGSGKKQSEKDRRIVLSVLFVGFLWFYYGVLVIIVSQTVSDPVTKN